MAPHEIAHPHPLSPVPQSSLTLAPARFTPSLRSPDRHTFRAASPLSLQGPSLPWRAREPDDDASSRDYDVPR
jgi:hypothetical protein